jgi:hypothetical protein
MVKILSVLSHFQLKVNKVMFCLLVSVLILWAQSFAHSTYCFLFCIPMFFIGDFPVESDKALSRVPEHRRLSCVAQRKHALGKLCSSMSLYTVVSELNVNWSMILYIQENGRRNSSIYTWDCTRKGSNNIPSAWWSYGKWAEFVDSWDDEVWE